MNLALIYFVLENPEFNGEIEKVMGQAKNRGNKEDRILQAKNRAIGISAPISSKITLSPGQLEIIQKRMSVLIANLTTPEVIDTLVLEFAKQISNREPMFIECSPEPWSRQSCCDANVLEYIRHHGGRMQCGYRIWFNSPIYIEGERHAIWVDEDQTRDVSFIDTGETKALFVPDDFEFESRPKKIRYAFNQTDQAVVKQFDILESMLPIQEMTIEQAWQIMPSYADWLSGKRMPNIIPVFK